MTRRNHKPNDIRLGEVSQFSDEREVGMKGGFFHRKSQISPKQCNIEQNLQQRVGMNLYIPY